jgi:hypothetical protein
MREVYHAIVSNKGISAPNKQMVFEADKIRTLKFFLDFILDRKAQLDMG